MIRRLNPHSGFAMFNVLPSSIDLALSAALLLGCAGGTSTAIVQDPSRAPPPSTTPAETPSRRLEPFPGVVVYPEEQVVEIAAEVCLDGGWLEQIACAPGTREHEALVVMATKPSEIHASLLLAGLKSGTPGRWVYENETSRTEPPQGDALNVFVRYDKDDKIVELPIAAWIVEHEGKRDFPDVPWIFGGSGFAKNPPELGGGEYYVADYSGSIIGLVTFGDEVLGFSEVVSDQEALSPAAWVINEDAIPAVGTKVTIVLRKVPVPGQPDDASVKDADPPSSP